MRAVTYQGFMDVKVKDMPDPQIKNMDDIIVKVTHTSICGSDRHFYHGMIPSMKKDYIIGHEAIGIVYEIGSDVHRIKKGDKVVLPYNIACGECVNCKRKLESQCLRSNLDGEIGGCYGCSRLFGDYSGTQAEYVRVPYANFGTFKVPEYNEVADEELLLLTDAFSTAYWGLQQAEVKSGDTVIVLGCGPIGLITQKLAWLKGAKRVIAVDHIPYRLEHAEKLNRVEAFNFQADKELKHHLKEITKGGSDVVIDCVGMSGKMRPTEIMETALRLQGGALGAIEFASQVVRSGGIIQLVGIYGTRYNQFPLGDLFARNITLKMGLASVIHLIPLLYDLLKTKQVNLLDVITHHFPLEEAEHAYKIFNSHKENCLKIILKP
ncbi:alcohol dehydrogenase catalytic domain-containing protein [Metabacillus halosaccharovorans]|uniref:Alcohol dehydrogenase catalytic domain-containing protein n=1 Tax=Metabacillus halosaccharovorans TaxID=930124 RepID=A0ABT3DG07_9BACI|nr:alcohol dehydrogenase catalytic domain-containing protein [Metabacillus halosaccharovorans]MCV9885985.1 alcohol dehydrogenase catalytic domain-containing protein [Metabacillus halosaccharovorans]